MYFCKDLNKLFKRPHMEINVFKLKEIEIIVFISSLRHSPKIRLKNLYIFSTPCKVIVNHLEKPHNRFLNKCLK